jgi:adenylate cyclase
MEIERKFLVDLDKWENVSKPIPIALSQAYLHSSEDVTIRIRLSDEQAFLTIKGKTTGISREEFEYSIPFEEAQSMLTSFTNKVLTKKRYVIKHMGHVWEVDVFEGKLSGLVLAEIELSSEEESFEKPDWIGDEVSYQKDYYNAVLIERC